MSTDQQIEQEIQAKGLTAPRITPEHIEGVIASEWYINGATGVVPDEFQPPVDARSPLNLLTICVLVLKNGFLVTGESACASAANFDVEIGRKIARQNAREKIWALEGYLLKQSLHEGARKQTGFPIPETIGVVKTAADSVSDLG